MAISSTMYRFEIQLSDIDKSRFESIQLRLAQHPSETSDFLVTRLLAYLLELHEDLRFGKGLCSADEPALAEVDPTGRMIRWIDIGSPAAERLHKASKQCEEVVVYAHRGVGALERDLRKTPIHRQEDLRIVEFSQPELSPLVEALERSNKWEVTHTEGVLYIGIKGQTHTLTTQAHRFLPEG